MKGERLVTLAEDIAAEAEREYDSGYEKAYKNIPDLVNIIRKLTARLHVAETICADLDGAWLTEDDKAWRQIRTSLDIWDILVETQGNP